MPETMDTRLSRLRERAERALASGRRGGDVLTVLETMTREAPDGSAHALFAHRHLAELQLSGSPWRAALHLRRLVQAGAADDSAHALMGLSQALLGNYRMAVSAYRKAIKLAPRNPWYHHNLGHLLDVGLSESTAALDHLRIAQRIQPEEDEIAASLAHCLARLGQLEEAEAMATQAVRRSPRNREHQGLLEWVKSGAPSDVTPAARPERRSIERGRSANPDRTTPAPLPSVPSVPTKERKASHQTPEAVPAPSRAPEPAAKHEPKHEPKREPKLEAVDRRPVNRRNTRVAATQTEAQSRPRASVAPEARASADREVEIELADQDPVLSLLEAQNQAQSDADQHLERARTLWSDFCARRSPKVLKPATYAAALEYTLSKLPGGQSVSQAELARRYNVTAKAIASRHEEIRTALGLPTAPR